MSFIANIVAKIGSSEKAPVIRMRGCFRSSKRLTLYFPGHDGRALVLTSDDFSELSFSVVEAAGNFEVHYSTQESRGTKNLLATFKTAEEAYAVIAQIVNEIAPSYWRIARRVLLVWFVLFLVIPNSKQPNTRQAQMQEAQQILQARQMQAQGQTNQMYVAPQVQAQQPAMAPQQQVEQSAPSATNDPFGLRLDPSSK